ncbi:MAG: hypothetical protein FJ255_05305 [Phycisphaerae bacterium]|nr:hypothetical protein [Phycisphaerae bacterium]
MGGLDRQPGAQVTIPIRGGGLRGTLHVPTGAGGVVLFAHGSGSGRLSPRNRAVAGVIRDAGTGTLLFDLLTEEESAIRANVFDIPLLAERLRAAADWLHQREPGRALGYFGASTGAGAALVAAAGDARIRAVVSRGGRPDLAAEHLPLVTAPTLLIVGGLDDAVLDLNREALARLRCEKRLEIVPGATHLFEEPGALETVARLASDWFAARLLGGTP